MKKKDAISLFGSGAALARALGLSRGRIAQWENDLTEDQANRVIGVAVRKGIVKILSADEKSRSISAEVQPHNDSQMGEV